MEDLIGHSWCFKSPQGGQKHFYDSNGVHVQMFNGDGSRQLFGTAPGAWELVKGGDGAQVLKEYIRPTNNTYVSISDD